MPEFKDRLKECRQAKGLRQQDAAEQLAHNFGSRPTGRLL